MLPRILEPEIMDTEDDALAYDAMDHAIPNTAFVNRLLELGATGRMLDIGTGPGHIPLMICARIPSTSIIAIDLSENMLTLARSKLAASPHTHRITFQRADAKRLPFPDQSFDTVFSNTILHHIPDPAPFIAEALRVLKPVGTLLIRDLFRPPDEATLDHLVSQYAAHDTPSQRALFRASLHAALTSDELRAVAVALRRADLTVTTDSDRHHSLQRPAHA